MSRSSRESLRAGSNNSSLELQVTFGRQLLELSFPMMDEHPVVDDLKLADEVYVMSFFLQDRLDLIGKLDFE
jgi:hypothetical protein